MNKCNYAEIASIGKTEANVRVLVNSLSKMVARNTSITQS